MALYYLVLLLLLRSDHHSPPHRGAILLLSAVLVVVGTIECVCTPPAPRKKKEEQQILPTTRTQWRRRFPHLLINGRPTTINIMCKQEDFFAVVAGNDLTRYLVLITPHLTKGWGAKYLQYLVNGF